MGDVSRRFPTEIPEMPFDGQAWIAAQQHLGRLCRFLGSSRLRKSRRPHCEHLEMIGIQIQGFPRPGQRRVILSEQVMAERVHCRPLISGVAVSALHSRGEEFDRLSMLTDPERAYSNNA